MRTVIVYHDNETLARRARPPRPGETVTARDIKDWDAALNAEYDECINLSSEKNFPLLDKERTTGKKK